MLFTGRVAIYPDILSGLLNLFDKIFFLLHNESAFESVFLAVVTEASYV